MKIKEIRLYPTLWTLDVIHAKQTKKLFKALEKRYGISEDECKEILTGHDCCTHIHSTKQSDLKGTSRIVVFIERKDIQALSHELIHALWRCSDLTGIEINKHSQEWQALLFEYMLSEALKTDYTKL